MTQRWADIKSFLIPPPTVINSLFQTDLKSADVVSFLRNRHKVGKNDTLSADLFLEQITDIVIADTKSRSPILTFKHAHFRNQHVGVWISVGWHGVGWHSVGEFYDIMSVILCIDNETDATVCRFLRLYSGEKLTQSRRPILCNFFHAGIKWKHNVGLKKWE
jgi:hypothetical protein